MKLFLNVGYDNKNYIFSFLNDCDYCRLELLDVFIIDCFKEHNHKYYFKAFFYDSKKIYPYYYCNSKVKLFNVIQNLLQEELLCAVQKF